MSTYSSSALLKQLKEDVIDILEAMQNHYASLPNSELLAQPAPNKWSIAQVLEHMNTYGRFYLLAIENVIAKAGLQENRHIENFTSGWVGDYFTKMMQRPAKMKSPSGHVPEADLNAAEVVKEFMEQQRYLLLLLAKAEKIELGKWRVPITLTSLIRLKLGDVFRFLIAHEQRHMMQIKNAAAALKQATNTVPANPPVV